MEMHPSSFLETGSCTTCTGPRYTRSQPNRESSGVLLNSVTDKYVAEFDIPYRNIIRYVKEMENNWPKLDQRQRDIVSNSLAMFVVSGEKQSVPEVVEIVDTPDITGDIVENFGAEVTTISECVGFLSEDPVSRVDELLDQLVYPGVITKKVVEDSVGLESTDSTLEQMKNTLESWCYNNSYYKGSGSVWAFFIFLLIIFMLIGVGTGYNCK